MKSLDMYIENAQNTKEKIFMNAVRLFSEKGYNSVGIRTICKAVGIKESSFYNHYKGKNALFEAILEYFVEIGNKVVFSDEEIKASINQRDVGAFFLNNMENFSKNVGNPLIHTILQIINMESYTNEFAFNIAKHTLYYSRKDYTEKVLQGLYDNGSIIKCDIKLITAEYYYGLKAFLDEYLLYTSWDKDITPVMERIENHIDFYTKMLQKEL